MKRSTPPYIGQGSWPVAGMAAAARSRRRWGVDARGGNGSMIGSTRTVRPIRRSSLSDPLGRNGPPPTTNLVLHGTALAAVRSSEVLTMTTTARSSFATTVVAFTAGFLMACSITQSRQILPATELMAGPRRQLTESSGGACPKPIEPFRGE